MKKILCSFGLIVLLGTVCAGCKAAQPPTPTSTPMPPTAAPQTWKPALITEVNQAASAFEKMMKIQEESYGSTDKTAFRTLYVENAVFKDMTYGQSMTGVDRIIELLNYTIMDFAGWKVKTVERYIGLTGGVAIEHQWDFSPDNYKFTQDDPMTGVDWFKFKDGLISRWVALYSLDSMEKGGAVEKSRLDQAKAQLAAYQTAWSSGDPNQVAGLYDPVVARSDPTLKLSQDSKDAVAAYTTVFFKQFPGAKWTLAQGFGEGKGPNPVTGGIFDLQTTEADGKDCDIRTVVILKIVDSLITQEDVFYEPDSLIVCGWAQ